MATRYRVLGGIYTNKSGKVYKKGQIFRHDRDNLHKVFANKFAKVSGRDEDEVEDEDLEEDEDMPIRAKKPVRKSSLKTSKKKSKRKSKSED